jgi:diguanylate cyclase (GGDEF)-like protein
MVLIGHHEVDTREREWQDARVRADRFSLAAAAIGTLFIPALCIPAAVAAGAVASGFARDLATAGFFVLICAPFVFLLSRSQVSRSEQTNDAMAALQTELRDAVAEAEAVSHRRELEVQHQEFQARLTNALEMATDEGDVLTVVEQTLRVILPESPVELLLADNSHAHLLRLATASPTGEPPGCGVESPDQCPATRRAQTHRFRSSEDFDACPRLQGRALGPCSAICVPVSIMGRTVGVIHAVGPDGAAPDGPPVEDLATIANVAGARLGLLRVMAETQLQAATDGLTGLLNRRSLENKLRVVRAEEAIFSVVMADLDHFKDLNDTHGHETGDSALRVFASTLRRSLRTQDLISRHGGEEFVVVLPGCGATEAARIFEHVRAELAGALRSAALPLYTVSYGIVGGTSSDDFADLLRRADSALFEAKRAGRDRIVLDRDERAPIESSPPATDGPLRPWPHEAQLAPALDGAPVDTMQSSR